MARGGIESSGRRAVERDVEMNAPLIQMRRGEGGVRTGSIGAFIGDGRFGGQCVRKVAINDAAAVGAANDDLVQVGIFGECAERLSSGRSWDHSEGRAQVKFVDLDLVLAQGGNGI